MDMKIWNDNVEIKQRWLRLVESGQGAVLRVVDDKGDKVVGGNILTITQRGLLLRHQGIDLDLGIILDDIGRIKLDE